jgi:hypothetical protein
VPATQIAQNLAFINWTVLTGLALGSFAAVVLLRRRTAATGGFLGFTTACALAFGILAWLSDGALPSTLGTSPVVVDPAWDAPRRTALGAFCVLLATVLVVRRFRTAAARALEPVALAAGLAALVFGSLAWGDGGLGVAGLLLQLAVLAAATGGVFAAMILGHWYLVTPKLPEAPLILLSRLLFVVVAVQVGRRAMGALRLAAADHRADLPARRVLGGRADGPDPEHGVGDRAPVHQRRHDRGRHHPRGRAVLRRRAAGLITSWRHVA